MVRRDALLKRLYDRDRQRRFGKTSLLWDYKRDRDGKTSYPIVVAVLIAAFIRI